VEIDYMKKAPIITIVTVVVLALIALGFYLSAQRQQPTTTPSTTPNMNQPSSSPEKNQSKNTQQTPSSEVAIKNFAFSPAELTVKKGTTVKWTNSDDTAHNVIESDDKTGPSSPLLDKNQSYSFTYNKAGTYTYKCSVHPYMTGSVTVTE
jgi:amicyanin